MTIPLFKPARCTWKLPEDLTAPNLVAEPKIDGSRYMLYIHCCPYNRNKESALLSRRESVKDGRYLDKADNVPYITKGLPKELAGTVLDGEIVAKSGEFLETMSIMNSKPDTLDFSKEPIMFVAFDILAFKGIDITYMSLKCRREYLLDATGRLNERHGSHIQTIIQDSCEDIDAYGWCQERIEEGGEGLVIKDINAPYGVHWAKMKKSYDVSCIITGFKPGKGKYADMIGSLELSVIDYDGQPRIMGYASGFDDALRLEITNNKPKYLGQIVDVFMQEMLKNDGRMRHATFHRFRPDLNAKEVTLERFNETLKTQKAMSKRTKE